MPFKLETKYHWCVSIPVDYEKSYDLWPSCDPNKELCDGGGDEDRIRSNKHLWTSSNDHERTNLKWKCTIVWEDINHSEEPNDPELIMDNEGSNDHESSNDARGENEREHWCEKIRVCNDDEESSWASCDPYGDECNGGSSKERVGQEVYY